MGMPLKIQEKYKTLNRVFQGKTHHCHSVIKTLDVQTEERLLKAAKVKNKQCIKSDLLE